jgi:uncharacterized membrane protein YdjX (TVP38/TMEM64 family)
MLSESQNGVEAKCRTKHSAVKWVLLVAILLAIVLIPFFLAGSAIESWTKEFIDTAAAHPWLYAAVLGGLLASDILLPIPSSIVSSACGLILGATMGTAVSLLGMTVSCILGYWLARGCGRTLAVRLVSSDDLDRFQSVHARFEDWAVVFSRPIPVLAEVSVLFAGLSRMPAPRFFLLSTLANLGISLGYALVGAYASNANAFFVAFAGAMVLPGLAMGLARIYLISSTHSSQKTGATP